MKNLIVILSLVLSLNNTAFAKESNQLSVLSLNPGFFSAFIEYFARKRDGDNPRETNIPKRAKMLSDMFLNIEEAPDVILLQEIWSLRAKSRIKKALKKVYPYSKSVSPLSHLVLVGMQRTGLMIFSKYKIEKFDKMYFSRAALGTDRDSKMGLKGVVGARIVKNGVEVNLFNTHLANAGSHHDIQLMESAEFIRDFGKSAGAINVYAGDFNIRNNDTHRGGMYKRITGEFFPEMRDTYNIKICDPAKRKICDPRESRIDYIFVDKTVKADSYMLNPLGKDAPKAYDHPVVMGLIDLDN